MELQLSGEVYWGWGVNWEVRTVLGDNGEERRMARSGIE